MDSFDVEQDRGKWWAVVKTEMNIRFPKNAVNFSIRLGNLSFSKRTIPHGVSERKGCSRYKC